MTSKDVSAVVEGGIALIFAHVSDIYAVRNDMIEGDAAGISHSLPLQVVNLQG